VIFSKKAVANQSKAVGAETTQKNTGELKNHKSRENQLITKTI